MQERRSQTRMLCADLVEVFWRDPDGKRCRASALLEDISVTGACLQMETPLPVGVQVRWCVSSQPSAKPRSAKKEFTGVVRYCEYREIGYFTGVEFDSASRWSKKAFHPQHLLDLKHLMAPAKQ
ncbi:MAG: PilZ domain-containing protein [Acidobacteriia bacterium]|nr:PilZ domain-containing protein [Terriglobia bacterium]